MTEELKGIGWYEKYPIKIVFLSNLHTFSVYAIGIYIMLQLGFLWLIGYILLLLFVEIRVLVKSCVDCCYYGKRCFSGRGLLCSLFFKKGDPKKYLETKIRPIDLIPEFSIGLIPIVAAIYLMFRDFSWLLFILIILLFLSYPANVVIRGSYACKFCKQRELGCPAEEMFNEK